MGEQNTTAVVVLAALLGSMACAHAGPTVEQPRTAVATTTSAPPPGAPTVTSQAAGPPGDPAPAHEHHGTGQSAETGDTFASMMHDAMTTMDRGMNVACTDDADRDFAVMMVPHHQGAVDMALAELRFGRDPRLRRLAEGIIVEQRQEIALMRAILAEKPAP